MGKLSKTLLRSLLLSAAVAQETADAGAETEGAPVVADAGEQETTGESGESADATAPIYAVTGCNDESSEERPPALSFKIARSYFDNNLADQTESFTLNEAGTYYERTIAEADLTLSFDTEEDDIILSYSQDVTTGAIDISDDTSIRFADDAIEFKCRYARSVSATSDMTVTQPDEPASGLGELTYSMSIEAGTVGGNSVITVTPNHSISGVGARLTSCNVSSGDNNVFAIHSFRDDAVCFDQSRLNVVQTEFGESVEFSMRTFRFTTEGAVSAEEQEQTVECQLHLEPIADITQDQAADCTCHTDEECADPVIGEWAEWGTCSTTCGAGEKTRARECTASCANIVADNPEHVLSGTEACNLGPCPAVMSQWANWGSCSVSCGAGSRSRSRTCTANCENHDNNNAAQTLSATEACNNGACPVVWTEWSSCSHTCGAGRRIRRRGNEIAKEFCNTTLCPDSCAGSSRNQSGLSNYVYSPSGNRDRNLRFCRTNDSITDQGILVVYSGGRWGAVCDDSFDSVDAKSACYTLGFADGEFYYGPGRYPTSWSEPDIPFLKDDMACSSPTQTFTSCSYNANENCSHSENTWVKCYNPCATYSTQDDIALRILKPSGARSSTIGLCQVDSNPRKGVLMVQKNGIWGSVCDDYFETVDAQAACRALGYSGGSFTDSYSRSNWGEPAIPFNMDDVQCTSSSQNFEDCAQSSSENCSHGENVLLTCS